VLAFALLDRTPSFAPWLRWTVLLLGIGAAVAVLAWRLVPRSGRRLAFVAIAGGAAAILAGPAAYSIATVDRHYGGGGPPNAGPATAAASFATALGGGGPPAGLAAILGGAGARGGPPAGLAAILGGKGPGSVDKRLTTYLLAHRGGARYLVAAEGSTTAAPIALSTRQPVITMGGFLGGDPAPTASELRRLVRRGQVRYVVLGGPGDLVAAGGPPGGGGSRRDRAGAQARQRWVTANCRAVSYGGGGRGPSQSLYDCSGVSAA
jgi:hypothetical protein